MKSFLLRIIKELIAVLIGLCTWSHLAMAQEETNEFPDSALFYIQKDSLYHFRISKKHDQQYLNGFQNYDSAEGINLGNIGTPWYSFNPDYVSPLGFSLGMGVHNRIDLPDRTDHYWVNMPYTRGMAVLGAKKEQLIDVLHTQNIKQNWNVNLNVKHISSLGFYKRQQSKINNVNFGISHTALSKFYGFKFNYLLSHYLVQDNGGLAEIEKFFEDPTRDKKLMGIKYELGDVPVEVVNFGENRDIRLKQYFNFGGSHVVKDSSLSFTNPKRRLYLETVLNKQHFKYNESSSQALVDLEIFDTIFVDTTKTADFTTVYKDKINFGFESLFDSEEEGNFGYHAGVGFENGSLIQNDSLFDFENVLLKGGLLFSNQVTVGIEGAGIVEGYNSGEFELLFFSSLKMPQVNSALSVSSEFGKKKQDFFWLNYNSNHFRWENRFDFKENNSLKLGIHMAGIRASVFLGVDRVRNIVYLSEEEKKPKVYDAQLVISTVQLRDTLNVGKFFLNTSVLFTHLSHDEILPLPKVFVNSSLYFESDLFKKVARLQMGFQLRYYSSFFAGTYNSSLNRFVNQTEQKYGGYPYIDFFVNARVKKVKVFLKIDHANAGLSGYNYFTFPGRPYHDRAIKLGLEWIFLK